VNAIPASTRRARILDRIRRDGGVTIAELARSHAISNMTAHRDLEQLASEGLVERVRGGARALPGDGGRPAHPTAWGHRIDQAAEAKAAIAAEATKLVVSGSTIFLDASSTALALASTLAAAPPFELTLVTNSPMIAGEIRADSIHVVVCPGELDQHTRTITGRWTVEFIRRLNFDTAFVSAAGISLDAGLTTSRSPIAEVLQAAADVAARTIGMVDATKFGRASLVSVLPVGELDVLISDAGLEDDVAAAYQAAGVALRLAAAAG
jgi:DeoR/GlpR family transcriptional regulator of sugar metabolism